MSDFKTKLFYLVVFCCGSSYVSYLSLWDSPHVKTFQREVLSFLKPATELRRKNNFLAIEDSRYSSLIINTTNCKVPEFSSWDPAVIPLVHKAEWVEDCKKIHYHWTFRNAKRIVFNETAMAEDGYKFDQVSCCYKSISRVEYSLDKYDIEADDLIKYSPCKEITSKETEIISEEFIMVECLGSFYTTVYRGFHAFAQASRSKETLSKIKFWESSKTPLPPNILLLGSDTTSRLNFRRNMIKTTETLEKLGAIEMMGYAKTGENTRPSLTPLLMGYSLEQVEASCHSTPTGSFDTCPLIWKRFNAANYLTAYSEDWPDLAIYNYQTAGFVKQPVDFYLRTLMNAAHEYGLPFPINQFIKLSTQWCLGHQTNDEVLVDYVESVLDLGRKYHSPVFSLSWSDTYPHTADHNNLQLIDSTYSTFINRIASKGHLENTILVFFSDHGQRFGPLRETLTGWYEDKLPNMWILLPKKIQEEFPTWQEALQLNSRRLTSPYTFYSTLNYLLDHYAPETPPPETLTNPKTHTPILRNLTQHFLTPVPEPNSCDDVKVPENFCPCYPLQKVELDDPILNQGALLALSHLNPKLPSRCIPLKLKEIRGGARMDKASNVKGQHELIHIYVVGFITSPGDILLEAEINYFPKRLEFTNTSSIQRSNKINQKHVQCVHEAHLQLFCYCDTH